MVALPGNPDARYLTRPQVIFEIASPATEQRDRPEKVAAYCSLPIVRKYAIVFDHELRVVVYRRTKDGWEEEVYDEDEVVRIDALGLFLPMDVIYTELPVRTEQA
jgi:Uma2 family endonuclease